MSHLHIPDGLLPVWLWAGGLVLALIAVGFSLYTVRGVELKKKVPLLGMMCAMMLVGMNLEIATLAYHVNLSVITGIILGPWLGIIAAFIVNIILSLVGHGGVTVVGLNTLDIGSECVTGYVFFSLMRRFLRPGAAAGISTVLSLFLSTCLMLLIVFLGNVDLNVSSAAELRDVVERTSTGAFGGMLHFKESFNFRFFAISAFVLGSVGWMIEALVTAVAVRFISVVKPEIIGR